MCYCLLPLAWHRKMDKNGSFSHHQASLKEIVEYAEQLEVTEHCYGGNRKGSAVKNNGQQCKEKSRSSQGSSDMGHDNNGGSRWHNKTGNYRVHGPNCGHSSHQCKVLIGHAENVWAQLEAQPKDHIYQKKTETKFKSPNNGDCKFLWSEVNTMLEKLKQKLEGEHCKNIAECYV